jgi:hypothetical protein
MSQTELKVQLTIHFQKKLDILISYPAFLEKYCVLHFQFRRAHYHSCYRRVTYITAFKF